jgi:hypothetical protein
MVTKKISTHTFGVIALVTGAMSLCLLTLPYYILPHLYNPKENAILGYSSPSTAEGWAFLIIGFVLLCFTAGLLTWLKTKEGLDNTYS